MYLNNDRISILALYRWGVRSLSQSKVYARVTNDPGLLRRAMNDINGAFPYTYCSLSPPTQLIIATWIDYQKTDTRQVSIIMLNKIRTGAVYLYVHKYMYICCTIINTETLKSIIKEGVHHKWTGYI